MTEWLKDCEICNAGLIAEVDRQCDSGVSLRKACELLVREIERKFKVSPYTAQSLRDRYQYNKGLRKKVVQNAPPENNSDPQYDPQETIIEENYDDIKPQPRDFSSAHHRETAQASAQANKQKQTSELERAATVIKQAARLLERIVEGDIEDNGTEYDRLSAESIRRYGPSIIISYYQLGIDPEKAVNFYKGEKVAIQTLHCSEVAEVK